MNVDVHSHIVDRQYPDNLVLTLALATELTNDGKHFFRKDGSTVAWSRDDMFDIDRRLDDMDKKDIAVRILSLSAECLFMEWYRPCGGGASYKRCLWPSCVAIIPTGLLVWQSCR